ncbi:PREDICTED: odorant receptor Or2-like [Dinoponera quadriceps]|uniref:Odorant receptor n=1 Tax=Dinoponera quadriceps TaxID=609295 RepID=A0A6P3Y7T4_DINQU|nr:PREDICTED: odorant receptor Or2-like [Dinoponera quadriceps]
MDKPSEMHVLEFTLSVLTVAGGWRPQSWTSLIKHIMYNAYTILLNVAVFIFTTTQFMHLIFNAANADEITESMYVVLVGMIGNFKIITISINYKNFAIILGNLSEKPFKPMEQIETMIQIKFEKMINFLNIACDCFFSGLLLNISCQIEILEYRLSKIANDHAKLRECVFHHYRIFEFAEMLNDKLVIVIGSQFIGSCLVVCCLLFRLTVATSNFTYIETIMCIVCALMAIFFYCWFGNEVRLRSMELSENIYKMEWPHYNNNVKKCLLIIMNRATSLPIKFTSARIIPLNLDSFLMSLQLSDNIYNMEWTMLNDSVKKGLLLIMNRSTIPIEFTGTHMPMNLESFVAVRTTILLSSGVIN